MAPRKQLARKRAKDLLVAGGVRYPPVPVEALAALVNAEIRYEPFAGELSGMVHRKSDGTAVIGVNGLHSNTRQRFTIAHELAHLLLHQNEEFHVDENSPIGFRSELSSKAVDANEIEANQFAAALLMPAALVEAEIAKLPRNINSEQAIARLSEIFQVSEQAMTFRLSGLRIIG